MVAAKNQHKKDAMSLETHSGLNVGALLDGRFEIVEHVADGGMGAIYRAISRPEARQVAIKSLHDEWLDNDEARARFEREAEAASRLSHPGIIEVFGYGVDPSGQCYLAMEWLEGLSLEALIEEEGALHPEYAVQVMLQVVESLAFAHGQDIIHRDLKPDNIFIVEGETPEQDLVKVLDFGIAKIQDASLEKITMAGTICGTPEYMSPEQSLGTAIDHRSDIYAIGCVFYAMLTGVPPFKGSTHYDTMFKHQLELMPRLSEELPNALDKIIQKSAAKKQAERFQSMTALAESLRRFTEGRDEPAARFSAPGQVAVSTPAVAEASSREEPLQKSASAVASREEPLQKSASAVTSSSKKSAQPVAKNNNLPALIIIIVLLLAVIVLLLLFMI